MFSALWRLINGARNGLNDEDTEHGRTPSPMPHRHATADFTEGDDDEETHDEAFAGRHDEGQRQSGHVLPIFSSTNLGMSRPS